MWTGRCSEQHNCFFSHNIDNINTSRHLFITLVSVCAIHTAGHICNITNPVSTILHPMDFRTQNLQSAISKTMFLRSHKIGWNHVAMISRQVLWKLFVELNDLFSSKSCAFSGPPKSQYIINWPPIRLSATIRCQSWEAKAETTTPIIVSAHPTDDSIRHPHTDNISVLHGTVVQ